MNESLLAMCNALDSLGNSILGASADNRLMSQIWGWNMPSLTRHDLAAVAFDISTYCKKFQSIHLESWENDKFDEVKSRAEVFQSLTVPHFFDGNGNTAVPLYFSLVGWIQEALGFLYDWQKLEDIDALPKTLSANLRSIKASLNTIAPEKEELERQIKLIKEATDTAVSLPTDLQSLQEARGKVSTFSTDAAELYGKIDTYFKTSKDVVEKIEEKNQTANKLVEQCQEAYRITTSTGLAAAFDERAKQLSSTMWIWVVGLLAALGGGAYIGYLRFEKLSIALSQPALHWGVIWMEFILSIVGLAAPIWLAWLATRQISQRFRLAEDYAFKASIAKAYEGYRREAANLDKDFELKLFASALTRLDEAPLRLIGSEEHSSPYAEFFNSVSFQKALESMPDLKTRFLSITKRRKQIATDPKDQEEKVSELSS